MNLRTTEPSDYRADTRNSRDLASQELSPAPHMFQCSNNTMLFSEETSKTLYEVNIEITIHLGE